MKSPNLGIREGICHIPTKSGTGNIVVKHIFICFISVESKQFNYLEAEHEYFYISNETHFKTI